jgi:AcrR family transcriptional regulator
MMRETTKHAQQIEKIVNVARTLFAKKGYSDTSLSDIAHEMNFRKASLYYYFKSKDEILQQIFKSEWERGESILDGIPTELDLEGTLYALAVKHLKAFGAPKSVEFMKIMIGEGLKNGNIHDRFFEFVGEISPDEKLLQLIRPKAGKGRTNEQMFFFLFLFRQSLFSHVLHSRALMSKGPMKVTDEKYMRNLARIFARGC